ncbi:MAG TPA: hypothetical protein GXZ43_05965 [Clostridiaceae bacterium]|nr:hypothetical protein [Clostridiaceae bacterium]
MKKILSSLFFNEKIFCKDIKNKSDAEAPPDVVKLKHKQLFELQSEYK